MGHQIVSLDIRMCYGDAEEVIHPVLLQGEENCILVDCGFVGSLPLIEAELERHGVSAEQITGIVLTHHDHDHMGAAAAFKRAYPTVKIYASERESASISGREKPLRLVQAEQMQKSLPAEQQAFGRAFCALLRTVEPVHVDVLLYDGDTFDWCGGCRVLASPGHTPGHISLYLTEYNAIIAGDAVALEQGRPVIANPQFALDAEGAARALAQLLELGADCIFCYHGGRYE